MRTRKVPIPEPIDVPLRRLAMTSLPSYRFVPGLQKHPELSSTHNMPEVPLDQCWDYGWDLYENHYWWEAHEVWERLWKAMPLGSDEKWPNEHPQRRYIQGHILLSASKLLEHMGRTYTKTREKAYLYMQVSPSELD